MDPQEREELSELRREQQRLQGELAGLSRKLQELEGRLNEGDVEVPVEEKDWEVPEPILGKPPVEEVADAPRRTPPPVPEHAKVPPPIQSEDPATEPAAEAPTPNAPLPVDFAKAAREANEAHQEKEAASGPTPVIPPKISPPKETPAGDWELNLGQVWFVRIGVGLVLTGLVFLSLYAYKNWIFNATALVKVSFFFAVSLTMVAGGYVIERWREHLRQYGQVLSAGGLAAGYYTIYAAHFVPALKVIGSPIAAAILLCVWAGGMLAYSVWRKGRILAVMSIGLAYYATVVNPSGWISLFSSLVLSASAMFLLIRYRWVWVGAVGVVAAYASHAFWLGLMVHEVTEPVRVTYLTCTWLLFSAAMQVPQSKTLELPWRRALIAVSNSAFWGLLVFRIPEMTPHADIGWLSIGVGTGWMLIAALTWWKGAWRREYVMLWGFQGLFIATLGLMIEASGYHRFMMLACQACVLLLASRWLAPKWTKLAAILVFLASCVFALVEGMEVTGDPMPTWQGYFFTSLFGFAFVILMRRDVELTKRRQVLEFYGKQHRFVPLAFAWAPWAMLIFGAVLRWDAPWTLIGLCATPLLLALARLFCERRETLDINVYAPVVVLVGGFWLLQPNLNTLPNWSYGMAIGLYAAYWLLGEFLRFSFKSLHRDVPMLASRWIDWVTAIVVGVLLCRWFGEPWDNTGVWMFVVPAIAIVGSLIYILTRRESLAVILSFLYLGTILAIAREADYDMAADAALPILAMVLHLVLTERYFPQGIVRIPRIAAAPLITIAFIGLVFGLDWDYPEVWIGLMGGAWLAFGFWRKDAAAATIGGMIPLLLNSMITLVYEEYEAWRHYLFMLFLPASCLMVKRLEFDSSKAWVAFRRVAGFTGLIILGIKLSAQVTDLFDGNGKAISWGLYAVLLFSIGLGFADKLFRRFGLFYLLIAVIHIIAVDAMKLDTLGRILSFLTLGAVLLLLGFLYNQYQDKIRKYL